MKLNMLKLDQIARGAAELKEGNAARLRKVVQALARIPEPCDDQ